jgi:FixJ family two-component response regulator
VSGKYTGQCVYIVDDDEAVRDAMAMLLDSADLEHRCFASADSFLQHADEARRGCLVLDIRMPGTSGLELQQQLGDLGSTLPILFLTGHGDVPMAVEAMRQGAFDFMRKPVNEADFLERIEQALDHEAGDWRERRDFRDLRARVDTLTEREGEVFERVAGGIANKAIAGELGISERTVEVHRAQVMKKLGARTLADLVRIHLQTE